MTFLTATAPGTWGVEPGGSPLDPPFTTVLDEIAGAGFDGCELGPLGYLPREPRALRAALAERSLHLAGGFVMEPFHDRAAHGRIRDLARETCATLAAGGARTLVLIEALTPERSRTAGRSSVAKRLDAHAWAALLALVDELATVAAEEFELAAVFHPHAGTAIEFADEIERLADATDPELLGLCLDTGHALYAGIDPLTLCANHGRRIRHVHAKDVRAETLEVARAAGSSFEQAVADGVFCPLGEGAADLAAVADALMRDGYDGWVVYEQDRPAGAPGAAAEAAASQALLARLRPTPAAGPTASAR